MKKWNYLMILGLIYYDSIQNSENPGASSAELVTEEAIEYDTPSYCINLAQRENMQTLLTEAQYQEYRPLKEYLDTFFTVRDACIPRISETQNLFVSSPIESKLENIIQENNSQTAYEFIHDFNILCAFIRVMNFCFEKNYYSTTNFRIVKSISQNQLKHTSSPDRISYLLAHHKLNKMIHDFQTDKEDTILRLFFTPPRYHQNDDNFFNHFLKLAKSEHLSDSKDMISISLALYFSNILFLFEIGSKLISHKNILQPYILYLLKIFKIYEKRQLTDQQINSNSIKNMISIRIKKRNEEVEKYQKELKSDSSKSKLSALPIIEFFNITSDSITLSITQHFKELYFQLYDLAKKSSDDLSWKWYNAWTDKQFTFPLTPNIPDFIEGYEEWKKESGSTSFLKKVADEAEQDLDALLALIEGDNKQGQKKQHSAQPHASKSKSKKTQQKSRPKQMAAEKMPQAAAAAAEKSVEQDDSLHSIYTYNKEYASVRIDFFPRVKEWWLTTLEKPLALDRQGYFTQGTDRSEILQRITIECQNNQNQAIKNIIFTHQLPTELVEATLQWGTVDDKTDPKVLQANAVVHVKSDIVNGYYLAEIGAKKQSDSLVSVFHSFLRPINNIQLFMINILTDTQNEENRLAAREPGQQEDNGSEKADDEGEWQSESGWIVTNTGPTIAMSKDTTIFTLFKQ